MKSVFNFLVDTQKSKGQMEEMKPTPALVSKFVAFDRNGKLQNHCLQLN